jgi:hypothetical protein
VPGIVSAIVPASAVGLAVATVAVWVTGPALPHLDAACAGALGLGGACSLGAYLIGQSATTRRLAVLGLGANLIGLVIVALVYYGS